MILQCPDCKVKLRPKPPAGTKPGQKVALTCPCGSRLRFIMPVERIIDMPLEGVDDLLGSMFGAPFTRPRSSAT